MEACLENGSKVRPFNVIDDYDREALMCKPEYGSPSERAVELLQQFIEWNDKQESIRTAIGTGFLATAFDSFYQNSQIAHLRIQKGKTTQNGYVERFNKTFREDVPGAIIFENLN